MERPQRAIEAKSIAEFVVSFSLSKGGITMKFSSKQRKDVLDGVNKQELDVIVIGGGITGSGIALDGATRGLSTIVFEMRDFAAGTSSRSTKLVHGGLRYLKQLEVKMVAEVGKERAIVYERSPCNNTRVDVTSVPYRRYVRII